MWRDSGRLAKLDRVKRAEAPVIGIGCLAPVILAVIGAAIGDFMGGATGAAWGLGAGFLVGGAVAALTWTVIKRYKEDD